MSEVLKYKKELDKNKNETIPLLASYNMRQCRYGGDEMNFLEFNERFADEFCFMYNNLDNSLMFDKLVSQTF